MEKLSNMQRVKEVNREEILIKIMEHCQNLLIDKKFLSNKDWETDTLLLQAENFLKKSS